MLELALHTGTEHPNLAWILIPTGIAFLVGLSIGHYAGHARGWLRRALTTDT